MSLPVRQLEELATGRARGVQANRGGGLWDLRSTARPLCTRACVSVQREMRASRTSSQVDWVSVTGYWRGP